MEAFEVFEYVQGSTGKKMVRLLAEDFEAILAELESRGLEIKEELPPLKAFEPQLGINIVTGGN